MCIVGFGHKRGRGKDTAATLFINEVRRISHLRPVRKKFAETLKDGIGRAVFRLTDDEIEGSLKETVNTYWGRTPREILQKAGEAMRYMFGEDIWARAAFTGYNGLTPLVFTDVRYPNEVAYIRKIGAKYGVPTIIVRVDRDVPPSPWDYHESETALDGWNEWDRILNNNGAIEDLVPSIKDLAQTLCTMVGAKK